MDMIIPSNVEISTWGIRPKDEIKQEDLQGKGLTRQGYRNIMEVLYGAERHMARYIPFLLQKFSELEADSYYAGCMPIPTAHECDCHGSQFQYGVGLYKGKRFLGHVPFEREFLGQRWNSIPTRGYQILGFLLRLIVAPSVAAEPRFAPFDGKIYSIFLKGPKLEILVDKNLQR